ncbi:hypothetical protein [Pseudoduganella aquatica]|uniref:hypothetical protein n=1 Tax=Pseudoduganella aquatica TaxID=2660641 RepID=UPI001E293DB2|nr:hypothetical protein [Pseudoduganella aquatica]
MQSYPFALDATNPSVTIAVAGDLFVYQKGISTGNAELSVKSDIGGEVDLIPGQRIRLPGKPTRWTLKVKDGVSAVTGKIVIGSGEFDDANTLNTFKLDGTFSNTVKVSNTPAEALPVTFGAITVGNTSANRVPVALDPNLALNIASGSTVAYTHKYISNASSAANTPIELLTAATNVNGVVLEKFDLLAGSSCTFVVLAKATAPVSPTDGTVVYGSNASGNAYVSMDLQKNGRVKIPAGLALWYMSFQVDSASLRSALFTVL